MATGRARPTIRRRDGLRMIHCTEARCRCRSRVALACGCESHIGGEMFHCQMHAAARYFIMLAARLPCPGRQECSGRLPCDGCLARTLVAAADAAPSTVGRAPTDADRPVTLKAQRTP